MIALLLPMVAAHAADVTIFADHKVGTQDQYGLCVDDGYSAIWGFWCDVTSFSPQSPSAVIAPGAGDPGQSSSINDVMSFDACWMDCSSGQCCAAFDFDFMSLQDLGQWTITCDGFGADPAYCTGTCTPTCLDGSLFDLYNLIYVVTVWNDPPTASISHSPTPAWNATVTLDANSQDPDGGSVTRTWSITSRPPGSTTNLSSTSSETPTLGFHSDDDIGDWAFQLHVDDDEGERKTFTHSFNVPNVPPNIAITGPTEIDALETIALGVSPASDVDGGDFDLAWSVTASPPGASVSPGSNYSNDETIAIPTTEADIGTWSFEVTATDNEGDSDTATHTIEVKNLPPEIHFSGDPSIDVGDTLFVETTFTEDLDGGTLDYSWDIIQVPQAAGVGLVGGYSTTSSISIPTGANHGGTWIFRLTVTDNEGESVDDEYTVFVDGAVHVDLTGPDAIAFTDFPLVLDGSLSWDRDSDCELDPANHCHLTLSGPPQGLTAGVTTWTWFVTNVPYDSEYWPGRVDEVFGIDGSSPQLSFDVLEIPPGEWTFELEVEDAEGNIDWTDHTVWILDPDTLPLVQVSPPVRYDTTPGGQLLAPVSVQAYAYDLDNLLTGDLLLPGIGIDDYAWTIEAPPGCIPPAPPTGPSASTYAPYAAGEVVPAACHGTWTVAVQVTDDDPAANTADASTILIIGNCPTVLCIDAPTMLFPALVEFVENIDIPIVYHLDSAVYDDPVFATGLYTEVRLYHWTDPLTPVYAALDADLLGTDKGAFLDFHWDGWTDGGARPETGFYAVEIVLLDGGLVETGISAFESDAIWIETAEVEVTGTPTAFVSRDDLTAGTDTISLDWQVTGAVSLTGVTVRILDGSATVVYDQAMGASATGTFTWDGDTGGGVTLPAGVYTMEVEATGSSGVLGTSAPQELTVYELDLVAVTNGLGGDPPEQFLARNADDDDVNGTEDAADPGPAVGEDELEQVQLQFAPFGADATLELDTAGPGGLKLWEGADKTSAVAAPTTWDLLADVPPGLMFAEGTTNGDVTLSVDLKDRDDNVIASKTLNVHVVTVDIDVDTNMDGAITVADDGVETDDQARIVYVNNDNDGGAGNDALNGTIENATDKAQLTQLVLRQLGFVPPGGKVTLAVDDKAPIRVFDEADVARIGPPMADGGPDAATRDVPTAGIAAGDLTYRVECVHGKFVEVSLTVYDASNVALAHDELNLALNVDRKPGAAYDTIRNRVVVLHLQPGIDGIEANLTSTAPIVSWDPAPPHSKTTSFWVSIQDNAVTNWLQSGSRVLRSTGGVNSEELYFEFVPDYTAYKAGTDPLGYQIFTKPATGWSSGVFRVEVTNTVTGEAQASLGGTSWKTVSHVKMASAVFQNYAAGTEPKQTVSRSVGSSASHGSVSALQFHDGTGWHAGTFTAAEIALHDTNGRGTETVVTPVAPATSATLGDLNCNWTSGQAFDLWDARN